MTNKACVARDLNHVAIAVRDIHATLALYQRLFGMVASDLVELPDQQVCAALASVGTSRLEFIQPTSDDSAIARFLERRGEALHHICFEVDDLEATLIALRDEGLDLVDDTPRHGLVGEIAFIHPRSTGGVLIELVENDRSHG